jgi:hypothetical protein
MLKGLIKKYDIKNHEIVIGVLIGGGLLSAFGSIIADDLIAFIISMAPIIAGTAGIGCIHCKGTLQNCRHRQNHIPLTQAPPPVLATLSPEPYAVSESKTAIESAAIDLAPAPITEKQSSRSP